MCVVAAREKTKQEMPSFTELPLSTYVKERLSAAHFLLPTPVQEAAIPPALQGKDLLATAQTGTGKTLAFLIPIMERLLAGTPAGIAALVLVPTRELAVQVADQFNILRGKQLPAAAVAVGGLSEGQQLSAIRRGARLLVATPGRLEDFLDRKLFNFRVLQVLVLDEADRMLDMGFLPAIQRIVSALPKERQTMCFSATLEASVAHLVHDYMRNPVRLSFGSTLKPAENVRFQAFEVALSGKQDVLHGLLAKETRAVPDLRTHQARHGPLGQILEWRGFFSGHDPWRPVPIAKKRRAGWVSARALPHIGRYRRRFTRHSRPGYRSCHQLRYAGGGGELHPSGRSYRPGRRQRCRIHDFFAGPAVGNNATRTYAGHQDGSHAHRGLASPAFEPEQIGGADRAGIPAAANQRPYRPCASLFLQEIWGPGIRASVSYRRGTQVENGPPAWRSVTDSSRRVVRLKVVEAVGNSVEGWFEGSVEGGSVEGGSVEGGSVEELVWSKNSLAARGGPQCDSRGPRTFGPFIAANAADTNAGLTCGPNRALSRVLRLPHNKNML